MWQVINKEAGKNPQNEQEMELKCGVKKSYKSMGYSRIFQFLFCRNSRKTYKTK
jgi:hypothetical protein